MTRLLVVTALMLSLQLGCKKNTTPTVGTAPNPKEYKITQGACGSVVYREALAANFEAAFDSLQTMKAQEYSKYCPAAPCYEIALEYYEIGVLDEDSVTPSEQFFAIRVLDKKTQMQVQSVSDVITSNGNLYAIHWCPD